MQSLEIPGKCPERTDLRSRARYLSCRLNHCPSPTWRPNTVNITLVGERRQMSCKEVGTQNTVLIGSQDNTSYKIIRLYKIRSQMQPIKGLLRYYLYIMTYYRRNAPHFTPLSHASLPLKLYYILSY